VARLSLFGSRRLYLIPRTLMAIHPTFDVVIRELLLRDSQAEVMMMFDGAQELWLEKLRRRLKADPVIKQHYRRVRFTKKLSERDMLALLKVADVVVDTFPIGMAVTAMEAYVSVSTHVACLLACLLADLLTCLPTVIACCRRWLSCGGSGCHWEHLSSHFRPCKRVDPLLPQCYIVWDSPSSLPAASRSW
jgi:hypothetical protein